MKIRIINNDPAGAADSVVCGAGPDETILLACARAGFILSAPCGGRGRCGKCRVRLLDGQVAGDAPDAEGRIRACRAVPLSDIIINCLETAELGANEVFAPQTNPVPSGPGSGETRERLSPARSHPRRAGVALDIGTTTVSARLVDLETSRVLDTISELNDQRVFGADVMSRIGAARRGKTGELFTLINRQTERILASFLRRGNLSSIEKLSIAGNTVMLHLFLNVDPSGMGEVPFTPAFLEKKILKGKELALQAESVSVFPSVAAFIGGDISAGLAALDIAKVPGPSLLVDIGTNGEMALYNRGTIFCCAAAAGPAFEGAEISCGVGGVRGAVSGVELADDLSSAGGNAVSVTTIGNAPPAGVCGSGLVDAVAVMLRLGIIDETGFMTSPEGNFVLAPGVSISAGDVRQFQLAKSAILSGIRILCKNAGLRLDEVKNVFVAGGFGFFIKKRNAVKAGIFPPEFLDNLSVCGNLSLRGAEESLLSENFLERCGQIISQCRIIDLASDPSFMDEFAENMLFNE